MSGVRKSSRYLRRLGIWLAAINLCTAGLAVSAHAAGYQNLPVVRPVETCDQLAKADVSRAVGAEITIKSASELDTAKGKFCVVKGNIAPRVGFQIDLPMEHWTQRYAQSYQRPNLGNAGSCMAAVNGEFAVATDDGGHVLPTDPWSANLEARIDFAYRANHETALVSKALIKIFYGQPQKFAYFVGCSEGGRQGLVAAQRFPDDFDGISAGAPVVTSNVHEPFHHTWEATTNKRADGTMILTKDQLGILHDAALAHCAEKSGIDGTRLQVSTACKFDPAWVQCPAGSVDTSKCLTAEEAAEAQKLYDGASDGLGHRFEMAGWVLGSELSWSLSTPGVTKPPMNPGGVLRDVALSPKSSAELAADAKAFTFSQEWYDRVDESKALYNAANTNLRPFQKHGGKLIMWDGGSDTVVEPAMVVGYYQGVEKDLGAKLTDSFMRYFILPGVGHCGGGDGPNQMDVLTPLMAWVESHQAPTKLMVGKTAVAGQGTGQSGAAGDPYPKPDEPTLFTRPVYPYPDITHFTGSGDPNDAANYEQAKLPTAPPPVSGTQVVKLIGPDNQKFYHVENGELVPNKK